MHIKKMCANFGKISGESLELCGGLNIIYAKNEGGKSTWCAFLQAMLYGIDSSSRSRKGSKPDKTLYAPWSGEAMEGTMDICFRERDISISRTGSSAKPFREFRAVYTGTNEPVDGLTGVDAGEILTGATKPVFQRSAFLRQPAMSVDTSPELEKRIAAIVSTGEEQSSYTETEQRLKTWMRSRRYNNNGRIPRVEKEIQLLQQQLDVHRDRIFSRQEAEEKLAEITCRRNTLAKEVAQERKLIRQAALERMSESKGKLKEQEAAYQAAAAQLKLRQEELSGSLLDRKSVV